MTPTYLIIDGQPHDPCPSDLHASCDHRSERSKWANVVYVWHAIHIVGNIAYTGALCTRFDRGEWLYCRLAEIGGPLSNSERVGT
jgi:hypothetical protein